MTYQRIARIPLIFRIVAFFGLLVMLWAPWAFLAYCLAHGLKRPEMGSTMALGSLYICFMVHAWWWGRGVHRWRQPFQRYGLIWCDRFFQDLGLALIAGVGLVTLLFGLEVSFGWASFAPAPRLMAIALEGLAVGLGIGFAEELLFRGWLLAELRSGLSNPQAIAWSGLLFAAAHFIKPLADIISTSPQFLGLLLLGLILGSGRYISRPHSRFTSLGLPIGLHGGLVWGYYIVDVADLITFSGTVPDWITGLHGNPLSGVLGVAILGGLAHVTLKLHPK